jgi:hypothetical protein
MIAFKIFLADGFESVHGQLATDSHGDECAMVCLVAHYGQVNLACPDIPSDFGMSCSLNRAKKSGIDPYAIGRSVIGIELPDLAGPRKGAREKTSHLSRFDRP